MSSDSQPARSTVTAVLANYNHAHLLEESLGSLLAQSRPFDEIIVVDDCSTDDSVERIRALTAGHANVRLQLNETNRGIAWNNDFGLAEATGDYVGFYAADDRYAPAMVEELAAALDASPAVSLAGGFEAWMTDDGAPLPTFRGFTPDSTVCVDGPGYEALSLRHGAFLSGASCLYRTAALRGVGGFDPELGAYQDVFVRERLCAAMGMCFVPSVLGYWRRSEVSFSATSARQPERLARVIGRLASAVEAAASDPGGMSRGYARRLVGRYRHQAVAGLLAGGRIEADALRGVLPAGAGWKAALLSAVSDRARLARITASLLLVPGDYLREVLAARRRRATGP